MQQPFMESRALKDHESMADWRHGRVSGGIGSSNPTDALQKKRTRASISLHPSTAKQYSKETLNVLRRLFTERDVEHDGILNSEELEQCLQIVGFCPTSEDIKFLTKHFDTNGDGVLQIEELLENIHIIQAHSIHKTELMDAFEKFDTNNDGYIRLPEMLKILTINNFMTVEDARTLLTRLIEKYDHNGDGKFSYAEFVEAVMTEGKMSEDLIAAPTLNT